ncbi:hypothetical protein AF336_05900 [Bradyrhizobium diazoefficiens]|nr:hypothetical protein BD122_13965 [Bradyrhizobium diazoefficiens]KOY11649.1 hypothetical protein AF336_05900 [Bradyrhizobium diazoefficiens]PDT61301.1 hypothetical protein CO678_10065 [Bradyrhizobium diazoefficiens]
MFQSDRRRYLDQRQRIRTRPTQSRKLSMESGGPIWLKLEALQSTGSFKVRGLGQRTKSIC